MNQTTLKYYNENAEQFSATTKELCFCDNQDLFLSYLQKGARILDFGCGAGRDTKYFMEHDFWVTAVDGSKELCKLASKFTGISVQQMLFSDLHEVDAYDGIWACASILHVAKAQLREIFICMHQALKQNGILYASFKYGTFEGERNGRYFTDFTEDLMESFLDDINKYRVIKMWTTMDVRPGRENEKWLNILLMKKESNK